MVRLYYVRFHNYLYRDFTDRDQAEAFGRYLSETEHRNSSVCLGIPTFISDDGQLVAAHRLMGIGADYWQTPTDQDAARFARDTWNDDGGIGPEADY